MAEYISREEILKFPVRLNHYDKKNGSRKFIYGVESVMEYIEYIPSADVEVVRHGHWIKRFHLATQYECSECHKCINEETHYDFYNDIMRFPKYCEHCGAKMDGVEGNSDV